MIQAFRAPPPLPRSRDHWVGLPPPPCGVVWWLWAGSWLSYKSSTSKMTSRCDCVGLEACFHGKPTIFKLKNN